MSKKILIICTSPRLDGNTEQMADAFAEGASEAGHSCEKLVLAAKKIDYCIGCMACQKLGKCVLRDDANAILDKMAAADVLVFASPIYFYSLSGQLKTFLDRTNPLYERGGYLFRQVYLLTASADADAAAADAAVLSLRGWINCFEGTALAGHLNAAGVNEKGEVAKTDYLKLAKEMGRGV